MLTRLSLLVSFAMFLTSGVLRVAKPAPPAGGLLVVANQKEHTLLLVDPENRRELAKIVVGANGHEVMASKDGRRAYTANVSAGSVSVLDLSKRNLVTTIPVAKSVQRISISPDGRRVLPMIRTHLASPSSIRPRTKSRTGSNCRTWPMRRSQLPMAVGSWRSAWLRTSCSSLICRR